MCLKLLTGTLILLCTKLNYDKSKKEIWVAWTSFFKKFQKSWYIKLLKNVFDQEWIKKNIMLENVVIEKFVDFPVLCRCFLP